VRLCFAEVWGSDPKKDSRTVATPAQQETRAPTAKWRHWIIVSALVAATGLGVFFVWRWDRDRAERQEALRTAEHGRFSDAEPLLLRVAQRHPDDLAVVKQLALGYLAANRLAEAEPYFSRWCEAAGPGDVEPYKQRLVLWRRWHRIQNLPDDARRVLEREPDNRQLRQQLALWLFTIGQFAEAEHECQRLLRASPEDPWILLLQAGLHQRQGRLAAATALADRLVRDRPNFTEAVVLRATLYLDGDQPGEAIPLLRRAAAVQGPHRREALYQLSAALARTGQTEEAQRVMAEARSLHEMEFWSESDIRDNPNMQVRLAEELLNAGQLDNAFRLLTKLVQQDPNCAAAHRLLATYYDKQGQPERAVDHRRRADSIP
jgi:predicted Zn-dependent protease